MIQSEGLEVWHSVCTCPRDSAKEILTCPNISLCFCAHPATVALLWWIHLSIRVIRRQIYKYWWSQSKIWPSREFGGQWRPIFSHTGSMYIVLYLSGVKYLVSLDSCPSTVASTSMTPLPLISTRVSIVIWREQKSHQCHKLNRIRSISDEVLHLFALKRPHTQKGT